MQTVSGKKKDNTKENNKDHPTDDLPFHLIHRNQFSA